MSKKQEIMKSKRLQELISDVEMLYRESTNPWLLRDWIFEGHVRKVAQWAEHIAAREGGNTEFVIVAAHLHDIGDVWIEDRDDPSHEETSLQKAQELLHNHGFNPDETTTIVEHIIKPHSCKEVKPTSLDGKIFATADALAHFTSDFYFYLARVKYVGESFDDFKSWAKAKIERDFHQKIFFDYWREYARPYYEVLKQMLT